MAIGAGSHLVVNCYTIAWKPGSLVLLSSDGLHGVVAREDLEKIVRTQRRRSALPGRPTSSAPLFKKFGLKLLGMGLFLPKSPFPFPFCAASPPPVLVDQLFLPVFHRPPPFSPRRTRQIRKISTRHHLV